MKTTNLILTMKQIIKMEYPKQHTEEFYQLFGQPGDQSNLKVIRVPYPLKLSWDERTRVSRITVHKLVVYDVLSVFEAVKKHYGDDIRKLHLDIFGGSYNYRKTRHGSKLSMHSWAIALDFDPQHNKLKWGKDLALFAKPEYDFWWEQWERVGWTSLGKAKNYDWMHVQAPKV